MDKGGRCSGQTILLEHRFRMMLRIDIAIFGLTCGNADKYTGHPVGHMGKVFGSHSAAAAGTYLININDR